MDNSMRFGPFELRATERKLLREGQAVPIGARTFGVLLTLVDQAPRLVRTGELLDAVWPGLVVEEANLSPSTCIRPMAATLSSVWASPTT